jgi:hypothetical protein
MSDKIIQLAEKKKRLRILQKAKSGGELSATERLIISNLTKEGAGTREKKYPLSEASLKLLALEGRSIAEAETLLSSDGSGREARNVRRKTKNRNEHRNLNRIFTRNPALKQAWERGRFLRALSQLGETNLAINEVETELKKIQLINNSDDLRKILSGDIEATDTFNQARHKHLIDIQKILKDNLHKASPAAIRVYKTLFTSEIAPPAVEAVRLTSKQIQKFTGYSRQSVEFEWPRNYGLSRNSDGTYDLAEFIGWLVKHLTETTTRKTAEPLRDIKAQMLDIEMKKELGQLLDRNKVAAGLAGRNQTIIRIFTKCIAEQRDPYIKQTIERAFEDVRREIAATMPELKLDEEQAQRFKNLLDELNGATADYADSTDNKKTENPNAAN